MARQPGRVRAMSKVCPRCAATVASGETNHEYHCLEHQLVALYKIGIQRGLEGEATDGLVDDQAAGLIGRIMELAGEWRLAGKQPRREPGAAATLAAVGRAQAGLDIDT